MEYSRFIMELGGPVHAHVHVFVISVKMHKLCVKGPIFPRGLLVAGVEMSCGFRPLGGYGAA
jgi:hypothetical protein